MREDMARVIVERPRRLEGGCRKGRARPIEDLPSREGMRRPHQIAGNWKMLNENLNPLRRYLERQVGRPWNKVYAEIAARLRVASTVQQHVRDHLRDFVAVHPRRRNYTVYWPGGGKERIDELWFQPLYVDPKDGILKRTDRLPEAKALRRGRRGRPPRIDRIELAPDRALVAVKGLWYEARLAPLPEPVYTAVIMRRKLKLKPNYRESATVEVEMTVRGLASAPVIDAISGRRIPLGPEIDDEAGRARYRQDYPDRRYAVSKRQLSRAELRRYGVRNEVPELALKG